ncbi:SIMPL domain-containing protein [Galbibacter sp. EGI 63066]|uniref:SIMPL domain-containing protein n=1 Tax=Galbibacter sp. EGI 63066 TaxID=2993559 RepID=UPI002248D8FF|nr:SIMPL domain-containing protein [Galbibacter sp. EGI 63066]MCX2680154.1 SIMPL domain-containing protein [Galbibacter sp. EGI 63066]
MKKIILVLTAIIGMSSLQAQEKPTPAISVIGEGVVKVVPDQVLIKVRVESEGTSAKEVKSKNDIAIDKVIKYARSMKIDEKDIRTEYVNLNKNYNYQTKEYKYVANQSMSILLRDLDKYAEFTEGLLNAGINRIDGVTFKSDDLEKYKTQARKEAVENAKEKAEEYASVLGQSIGKAIVISEGSVASNPRPMYEMSMAKTAVASDDSAETIAVGEMAIEAKINITFELK